MTVQLSVTLWTIICFCILMVVLRNLLFKPVLKVMDERRLRIDKANEKKKTIAEAEEKYRLEFAEKEKAFREAEKKHVKEQLEVIRAECKDGVEKAQDERIAQVDAYRVKADKEHEAILTTLSVHSEELALTFANSLLKG